MIDDHDCDQLPASDTNVEPADDLVFLF